MSKKPRGHIHKIREFELEKVSKYSLYSTWIVNIFGSIKMSMSKLNIAQLVRTSFEQLLLFGYLYRNKQIDIERYQDFDLSQSRLDR